MNQRKQQSEAWSSHRAGSKWDLMECDRIPTGFKRGESNAPSENVFSPDWANAVPSLIAKLVSEVLEKKKMELRFSLMESAIGELRSQLNSLAEAKTRLIAINTFSPEPYELLKPLLVSVQPCEDGFEAGWFDANIHTSGDNEEEAVSNLKSLILDCFEIFTNEPAAKLGVEPTRQLVIINEFLQKKP